MLVDLLANIFLVLLISIIVLGIVFVLGVTVIVVSGVKKKIRENNDTKH